MDPAEFNLHYDELYRSAIVGYYRASGTRLGRIVAFKSVELAGSSILSEQKGVVLNRCEIRCNERRGRRGVVWFLRLSSEE